MNTILESLKEQEGHLVKSLSDVRDKIREEKLNDCFLKHGVRIGSIVEDNKGVEHKIKEIDTGWDVPWLYGNPKKKDGTFGIARRSLYSDWKLVKS